MRTDHAGVGRIARNQDPGLGLIAGYGVGSLGTAVTTTVPPLLLLYYLTNTLSVPPAVAGIGLLIPQLVDVALTPLVGPWSDRRAARRGSRAPLLLLGALLTAVFLGLLFQAPVGFGWEVSLAYCAILYALVVMAATLFGVPHLALPAEMTGNTEKRTWLISTRMMFVMAGILISGAAAQPIVDLSGGGVQGYGVLSLVLATIAGATMLSTWWTVRNLPSMGREEGGGLAAQVRAALADRSFRALCVAYLVQAVGAGCALAAWPYFAAYIIGDEGATGLLFAMVIGLSLLAMPGWSAIAGRVGLASVYRLGTIAGLGGSVLMAGLGLLGWTSLPHLLPALVLLGLGTAALQLVPFSLMSDLSHAKWADQGSSVAGTYTGVWFAVEKIGMALGAVALSLALWAGGFQEGADGAGLVQTDTARLAILGATGIIPAASYLISLLLIAKVWRLSGRLGLPAATRQPAKGFHPDDPLL